MHDTVVVDGSAQLNISQVAECSISTNFDASCDIDIPADGDSTLGLTDDGGSTLELTCDGEFGIITEVYGGAAPTYMGETTFTPTWDQQVADTANMLVLEDITINSIQTYETSNDAGGITLVI